MKFFQILFWGAAALWGVLFIAGALTGYPGRNHAAVMGTIFFIGAVLLDVILEQRK